LRNLKELEEPTRRQGRKTENGGGDLGQPSLEVAVPNPTGIHGSLVSSTLKKYFKGLDWRKRY
jgi:hypothetical protein